MLLLYSVMPVRYMFLTEALNILLFHILTQLPHNNYQSLLELGVFSKCIFKLANADTNFLFMFSLNSMSNMPFELLNF